MGCVNSTPSARGSPDSRNPGPILNPNQGISIFSNRTFLEQAHQKYQDLRAPCQRQAQLGYPRLRDGRFWRQRQTVRRRHGVSCRRLRRGDGCAKNPQVLHEFCIGNIFAANFVCHIILTASRTSAAFSRAFSERQLSTPSTETSNLSVVTD